MRFEPFIQWMKQVHGKISSSVYGSLIGQTNSQQLAFIRNLEKEMEDEKSLFTPLNELEVVVFDFETTGFAPESGDEILSIGAIKTNGLTISTNTSDYFYSLVQYDGPLSQEIKNLTGLNEEVLKDAPPLSEVLIKFYQFAQERTLIAHHASHEKKFLQYANRKLYKTTFKHRVVDTSLVFYVAEPQAKLVRLEDYCIYCGIDVKDRHHALSDAKMTAQLWCLYVERLLNTGCNTLSEVYELYSKHQSSQFPK